MLSLPHSAAGWSMKMGKPSSSARICATCTAPFCATRLGDGEGGPGVSRILSIWTWCRGWPGNGCGRGAICASGVCGRRRGGCRRPPTPPLPLYRGDGWSRPEHGQRAGPLARQARRRQPHGTRSGCAPQRTRDARCSYRAARRRVAAFTKAMMNSGDRSKPFAVTWRFMAGDRATMP